MRGQGEGTLHRNRRLRREPDLVREARGKAIPFRPANAASVQEGITGATRSVAVRRVAAQLSIRSETGVRAATG